jgi:nitric-oxide synthase
MEINLDRNQLFLEQDYHTIPLSEISAFYDQYQQEKQLSTAFIEQRLQAIQAEIASTGTYQHTTDELIFGTRVAWRNAIRCIGRLPWKSLEVRDMRHLTRAEDIFQELVEHIKLSLNNGKICPTVTIFAPQRLKESGIRIWNSQLTRYAGYQQADGTVIGDPSEKDFTGTALHLGWSGGARTPFDILPIILQLPGESPRIFELPQDCAFEVPIQHPDYSWFTELNLKWHAFPTISNMCLEIGGIRYTAAPFSGWYLVTEIGTRNFADVDRYNLLPVIASRMGLDTHSNRTLWKDQALLELNRAVMYSYIQQKITIVDHHTASKHFVLHEKREKELGRITPADWKWIVPPTAASTTPVYHRAYELVVWRPNWFYQPDMSR